MRSKQLSRSFPLLFLIAVALTLSGCSVLNPQVAKNETAPTPVVSLEKTETETKTETEAVAPSVFVDPEEFKAALLQALVDQDVEKLERWMTMPFITGGWGADVSDSSPQDVLQYLYTDYLGTENHLEIVKDADFKILMGERDPLSMPRSDAGVIEAVLVSGWGKDGRDEAILFIARAGDDSLKWHGWVVINGGFSGARLGGTQLYTNETHGYSVYLPKEYEIIEESASHVLVMAPGEGHPGEGRAAAFIDVKPANGRTVEEIVEQVKADVGPGFNIPPGTAMGMDKAMAIVLYGLPGQDSNRQLFMVYNDQLVHIMFVPDAPQVGTPYWQMEDLYAMIVNTFHFTD
jgi:hypothetical protein